MGLCDTCERKRSGGCEGNEPWEVIVSCGAYKKPPTNADRIRAMSDEELAEWLNIMQSNAWHRGIFNAEIKHFPSTNAAWLDWLKQEVDDGEPE